MFLAATTFALASLQLASPQADAPSLPLDEPGGRTQGSGADENEITVDPYAGVTPDLASLVSSSDVKLGGGEVVYSGPDGTMMRGPFELQIPGQPPQTTPDDTILVSVPNTPSGIPEFFLVQPPETLQKGVRVPLLVAFHKCCNTMLDIIAFTDFDTETRARGWFLLAPLSAATANFNSIPAQLNTEVAIDLVVKRYGDYIDRTRVYGVGFSMGGGTALGYAARHVDPNKTMFAALVNHTGGLNLTHTYANDVSARPVLQMWFGGPPASFPFAYQRSSVVDYDLTTLQVARDKSLGKNLTHVPIFSIRAEPEAPSTDYLLQQNQVFDGFLTSIGGSVVTEIVPDVSVHTWALLDEGVALDFLEQFRLKLPRDAATLADRDGTWFYFDVEQDAPGAFTPFTWRIEERKNRFELTKTRNLERISFDPMQAGLRLDRAIEVELSTADGLADEVVLRGFSKPPVEVLRNDASTVAWTWDPVAQAVTLHESAGGETATWDVSSAQAAADLMSWISVDDESPVEGAAVVYTAIVRNTGPSKATGVVVAEPLPAGLTFVSSDASKGSYDEGSGLWTVGELEYFDVAVLDITCTVDVGTGGSTIVNGTTALLVTQADPDTNNDTASVALSVQNDADLSVTKSVDEDHPKEGETVVYSLLVSNASGGAQATGVVVSDVLPAGVTYVSDTPSQGSYSSGTGQWTVGTLASGASASLDITVTVDGGTLGQTIVNTASIAALAQNDPNALNDSDGASFLVVDDVDLAVTKTVDDPTPHELQQIVYTIAVQNTSAVTATDVGVDDVLPAGVTYVSDVPSHGSYDEGDGRWTIGTLAGLASATLDITVVVDAGTGGQSIVNTADGLDADQPDPNGANDSDSVQIDVDDEADLAVTKVVDVTAPTEQSQVVYTITVANPVGAAQATGVSLTDLLPAGVTYVSDVASHGAYTPGTGLWTIGTIAAGTSATLDVTASVDVGTGGQAIVNAAGGLLADQPDPNAANDSDAAQIDVENEADLAVAKVVDDDRPRETDTIVYTITVTNPSGGARATNVALTDALPAGVTYVSDVPSQGSYDDGTGLWTVGTLDAGTGATLDVTATVDGGTVGQTIVNATSGLTLDQTDPNAANDVGSVSLLVVDDVDLAVAKSVDDATPTEQQLVVWTITVTNGSATVAASGVELTDLLPAGVTYVSDVPSQGSYDEGTGLWTVGSIPASGSATLDVTASVDVATGGQSIVNTATGLALDQPDPNGANDADSAQIDVEDAADLSVTKTVDDATPTEQQEIVYTITVASPAGAARATNVALTDVLPAGVTYVSDVPSQGSFDEGTGLWTVGTLDAGTSATLDVTASVDVGTGGQAIVNTTSGLVADQPDPNAANDADSVPIDVETDADLAVTKTVDDPAPAEGDTVVYTITVTSPPGAAQATNVSLTDVLPAGVTYVSDVASQGAYDDGTGLWTIGTLAADSSVTLDVTATVDTGTGGQTIDNTTTALTADPPDPNAANDADTASLTVSDEVDLSVTKTVDVAAPPEGGTVVWTITVASPPGSAQATGVALLDALPAGVTYVSDVASQGSYDDVTGLWTVGTIDAGASATLDVTTTVDVGTGGQSIVNTAAGLVLDQDDPNGANDGDAAQIDVDDAADLSVTKVVDDPTPLELQTIVYTITLSNAPGGAQATGVTLTDVLPAGVTYVSDAPSQGTYDDGTGLWTVGTLATGAAATLDITATVDAGTGGGVVVNTAASPTLDQTDPNALNDTDQASITVDDGADLAVVKVVDDATPKVGGTVVYTITVTNPGGGAQATNVALTDVLPTGLTYASDTPSQGSYDDGTGLWTVGTIPAGASATLDLEATVDAGQVGAQLTNTTSGLTLDQSDGNASNDVGSVAIDVEPDVDLAVGKVVDDGTPRVGGTVVYTITVTNTDATEAATGVALTDVLPVGVTYVSDVPSQGSYDDGTGLWTVGTLAASANATLAITATVDAGQEGAQLTNTTSGLTLDQSDGNASNDVGSVAIDVEEDVDLAVAIAVDDPNPAETDTIVYTITVTNTDATDSATGVALTDVLPAGVTYVSDVPSQGAWASGTGLWNVGTIGAGASATLDVTVTVDAGTSATMITNATSGLTLDQSDSNGANDADSVVVTVS